MWLLGDGQLEQYWTADRVETQRFQLSIGLNILNDRNLEDVVDNQVSGYDNQQSAKMIRRRLEGARPRTKNRLTARSSTLWRWRTAGAPAG